MKRFDLDNGEMSRSAPGFRLISKQSQSIGLADYRSRTNLVLLFANGLDEPALQQTLERFAARNALYQAQNAEVLAIIQTSVETLTALDRTSDFFSPRLLADPDGTTHRNYTALLPDQPESSEAMLFVLDRFGAPHVAFLTREPADPGLHERLLSWLKGIELECPE